MQHVPRQCGTLVVLLTSLLWTPGICVSRELTNNHTTTYLDAATPTITLDQLNGYDTGNEAEGDFEMNWRPRGEGMIGGGGGGNLGNILNPFDDREEISDVRNGSGRECNVTSSIEYKNSVLVRIVYIPSFLLLFLSSFLLIYAILKFLKPLVKIYLSVLFYAACQLFLAACLILSMISSKLYDESMGTCRFTEPVQSVGVIMPGYAVFAITLVRFLFLKYPMQWRNVLSMPRQFGAFFSLMLLAVVISNLPNFGVCDYKLYRKGNMVQCRYDNSGALCTLFYVIYVTFGFVLPPVCVIIFYCLIYKIISKHLAFRQNNSRSGGYRTVSTRSSTAHNTSLESSTDREHNDKGAGPADQERCAIPWSILVMMSLNLLATLPWIPQALNPDLFYGCQRGEIVLLVDVLWSVLIVSVALSPIAYLVTTQSVRQQLTRHLCPASCTDGGNKYQKTLSSSV